MKKYLYDILNIPYYNSKYLSKTGFGRRFDGSQGDDHIYASLADSDCYVSKTLIKAAKKRLNTRFLLYVFENEKMKAEISKYYKRKYKLNVKTDEILLGVGVLRYVQLATLALSKPGDNVVLSTPCYGTFQSVFADNKMDRNMFFHRFGQSNEVTPENEKVLSFTQGWDELEKLFSDPKTKIFVLCSPHNPIGSVHSKDTLVKIVKLAKKYNVFIISDEIWQDFTFEGKKHIPLFSCCKEAKDVCVVISNPLKNFNCGGLNFGYAICQNKKNYNEILKYFTATVTYSSTNSLTYSMIIEMFNNPKLIKWHERNLKIIKRKSDYFVKRICEETNIEVTETDGMFLIWADFSNVVASKEELNARLDKIKVHLTPGDLQGGKPYELCARVNISLDNKHLKMMTDRLCEEFKK